MSKNTPGQMKAAAELFKGIDPHEYTGKGREKLRGIFDCSDGVARVLRTMILDATGERSGSRQKARTVTPDETVDAGPPAGTSTVMEDGRYLFEWRDPTGPRSMVLSEEQVQQIARTYTRDGRDQSMQATAIEMGLARRDLHKVKTLLGLTKDHEPFSPVELAERPEAELVADHLAQKRRRMTRAVEEEDYRRTKADAKKWLRFVEGNLDPWVEALERMRLHVPPPVCTEPMQAADQDYITVVQSSDLHYGLLVPGKYDREEAARRYSIGIRHPVKVGVRAYGKPRFVMLYIGGDQSTSDNVHGKTTSMNHMQDMDGYPETIPGELIDMVVAEVDWLLSQGHDVRCVVLPGNHSEYTDRAVGHAVRVAFRNDPRVTWGNIDTLYDYTVFGEVLILGHHGQGVSSNKGLSAMAVDWQRENRIAVGHVIAVCGHEHHVESNEDLGITVIKQPSPAESDRWSQAKGFSGRSRPAALGVFVGKYAELGTCYVPFTRCGLD